MKKRMAQKDVEGALAYFASDVRATYREWFKKAGLHKTLKITAQFGTIAKVYIRDNTAQYRVSIDHEGGTETTSLVDFLREDGKWRITQIQME